MKKNIIIYTAILGICLLAAQGCSSKKSCKTRGKNRVDMGWM